MIKVEQLSKSFGTKQVLNDVSLEIPDGKIFAILGQSGSGKSVLLKHIIGLLAPDSGKIIVDGTDVHALAYGKLRELRRNFGVLFQGGALFDSMTAAQNVAFPLKMFSSFSEAEIADRVQECLSMVELPDAGSKSTADLSGGMQKRIALARAISMEPRYIFYDEPTSGLDPQTSNKIDELIDNLSDRLGVTSVVITHDMHSVLTISDEIAFLYNGKIHWTGTVDDLHNSDDSILLSFVKANEYHIGKK